MPPLSGSKWGHSTTQGTCSLCPKQSFLEGFYFSVLAIMQRGLSKVWSQSSLILPKASDQTEGLMWKPVANTKDQTFHLCIFLEQRHSLAAVYLFFDKSTSSPSRRWLRSLRCLNIYVSRFTRDGQLPSKALFSHSNQSPRTCSSISLSFNHDTTHLEQYCYHDNI